VEHIRLVSLLRSLRWFQEDDDHDDDDNGDGKKDNRNGPVGNLRPSRVKMALLESLLNTRCFWTPRKLRGQTFREDIQVTNRDPVKSRGRAADKNEEEKQIPRGERK
jgi:hypothetical protein